MASDLADLRDKVAAKFDITEEDFDIVLEDDCTVVDDQDYFETLEANTLLMVLKGNQRTQFGKNVLVGVCFSFTESANKLVQARNNRIGNEPCFR